MKRPSFQFYPADWRKDPALRACSIEARGLWIDLICIMHESENYGFLEINSRKISEKSIATMCGITPSKCRKFIKELEENGVFSIDDRGVIFSRRMVKDNDLCEKRREAGKLGGNPSLVKRKDKQTEDDLLNHNAKQKPTPSSSYSSSTSVPPTPIDEFSDMPTETANDFDTLQRKIRNVHPHWKKPFSRKELDTLLANAKALMAVTDLEWTALGWFYGSEIPAEWGTFWRPDGRDRFMQDINDILIGSKRWVSECRRNGISLPGVTDQNVRPLAPADRRVATNLQRNQ